LIKSKPKEYRKAEKIQQIIKAEIIPILLIFVGKPWIATAKVARWYKDVEPTLILGSPRAEKAARRIIKCIDIPSIIVAMNREYVDNKNARMFAAKTQIIKAVLQVTDIATKRLLSKIKEP
jgi:hypothetical protein